jgi:hypothetical protein
VEIHIQIVAVYGKVMGIRAVNSPKEGLMFMMNKEGVGHL